MYIRYLFNGQKAIGRPHKCKTHSQLVNTQQHSPQLGPWTYELLPIFGGTMCVIINPYAAPENEEFR